MSGVSEGEGRATPATYESAGVNLAAAEEAVARIGPLARATFRPEVLSDIGGFGGVVAIPTQYRDPVLVSSTDGVGTKLEVAVMTGRFDTIGIDLVAMCADDIAVQGADPLFFLDYIAVGALDPGVVEAVVGGIAEGCRRAGCALVGGEVAEHGAAHPLELAGFVVGVVERSELITGATISAGDVVIGLVSPGLRSNGYSLARKVLISSRAALDQPAWEGADTTLADELLRPSLIYSPALAALRARLDVRGLAHVTGGGLAANLARVVPAGVDVVIRRGSWTVPRIFGEVQRRGEVTDDEMARAFNLGIGMVAVVDAEQETAALAVLDEQGCEARAIGQVSAGQGRVLVS